MELHFQNLGPKNWKADVMLVLCCEGEDMLTRCPHLDTAAPWLAVAPAMRDFTGKIDELALLHGHPELPVPRVLAIGLGQHDSVSMGGVRKAVARAVRLCRDRGIDSLLLPEPAFFALPVGGRERLLEECVCAALLALYRFTALSKPKKDIPPDPRRLSIGFADPQDSLDSVHSAARRGENTAGAVRLARNLANMPSNLLFPEALANRALEVARKFGFHYSVLDEKDLAREGMGALLAVGQGSSRPPRLIVLEHAPEECAENKPLILIGKGITFDTGGICLKQAANMHHMKCDMTGAAVVLAVIAALAGENIPRRVVGLLACAENMPGPRATRPGDVVTAANGDTIEILNTDAEGRLALCDAITYAQKHWSAAAMIDIATLTGACGIALGNELAGLFCDNDVLAERLCAAGGACGENFWRMPLWKPYAEHLKSDVADITNMGRREGGAITAALFLQHFVDDALPWAHLDIAGVDWTDKKTPLCPKGGNGFGARTLLELTRGGAF